jgi:hypothetical protein
MVYTAKSILLIGAVKLSVKPGASTSSSTRDLRAFDDPSIPGDRNSIPVCMGKSTPLSSIVLPVLY